MLCMKWFEDDNTMFNAENARQNLIERERESKKKRDFMTVQWSVSTLSPLPVVCEQLILCEYGKVLIGGAKGDEV